MEKAVAYFAEQLAGIHCGVITPALIDTVKVEYYGQPTPVKHLASTAFDGNRISVVPHDRQMLGAIDKTLQSQGFNSYVFNKTTVVVILPKYGIGSREKVTAQVRKLEEEAKVAVRNIRKKLRQAMSTVELKEGDKSLQALTDSHIERIARMADAKVESFMTK